MEITNGPDVILVRDLSDASVLINRLMALLANYSDWEARLRHAAGRKDLQEIVDIATEKLNNPVLLFDMDSSVLAMSSMFLDDDRNAFWNSCRETRRVPIGYSAQTLKLESGEFASWTQEPTVFNTPAGSKSIGNFIGVDGQITAGFAVHEADNPIRPGDLYLVRIIEGFIQGSLSSLGEDAAQRTLIQPIQDILAGVEYADNVLNMLRLPCAAPWRLLIVDNPAHREGDPMYRQLLLPRLRRLVPGSVSMEYDSHVVVIAGLDDIDALIQLINGNMDRLWFSVCLSLPFDDLRHLHARYRQAAFMLSRCHGQPGLYRGEDYALPYLASLNPGEGQALIHPLLAALKAHDAQKNSELYHTLFQYLVNERSIQKGAAAMHVHKNTYSYRLERIKELSSIDLEDPFTRLYLMVSFIMDGAMENGR